jgi:hypothetical protein
MQKLIHFSRDQSGEGYVDLAIVVLVIFVLMAMLLSVYPIFTVQQSLNNTVRHIARTAEITGNAAPRLMLCWKHTQRQTGLLGLEYNLERSWGQNHPAEKRPSRSRQKSWSRFRSSVRCLESRCDQELKSPHLRQAFRRSITNEKMPCKFPKTSWQCIVVDFLHPPLS